MLVFIIIFSILFSLIFIFGFISEYEDYYDSLLLKIGRRVGGLFCGFVVGFIFSGLLLLFGSAFQIAEYSETVTHEIVSMGDGTDTDASFFLGCGYIEENMVYNYYRKTDNGGIVRRSISADIATIYETDTLTTPKIVIHMVPYHNDGFWFPLNGNRGNQKYDIYLPKGSVIKDIKLDNK